MSRGFIGSLRTFTELLTNCFLFRAWLNGMKRIISGSSSCRHNIETAVTHAGFLAASHSAAARFYYSHARERSRDVAGLFEYLYHRHSSLYYLTALEVWLRYRGLTDPTAKVSLHWLSSECPRVSISKAIGDIRRRRNEYLNVFIKVLDREFQDILADAPPEAWLEWIATLIAQTNEQIIVDADASVETLRESGRADRFAELKQLISYENGRTQALRQSQQLCLKLRHLRAALLRQSGDYKGCLEERALVEQRLNPQLEEGENAPRGQMDTVQALRLMGECAVDELVCSHRLQRDTNVKKTAKVLRHRLKCRRLTSGAGASVINAAIRCQLAELKFEEMLLRVDRLYKPLLPLAAKRGNAKERLIKLRRRLRILGQAAYGIPFSHEQDAVKYRARVKSLEGGLKLIWASSRVHYGTSTKHKTAWLIVKSKISSFDV